MYFSFGYCFSRLERRLRVLFILAGTKSLDRNPFGPGAADLISRDLRGLRERGARKVREMRVFLESRLQMSRK